MEMAISFIKCLDAVYKWFDTLLVHNSRVTGYVIMPNHFHGLLYFPEMPKSLNTIIGNGKRFIVYGIIQGLGESNNTMLLDELQIAVRKMN